MRKQCIAGLLGLCLLMGISLPAVAQEVGPVSTARPVAEAVDGTVRVWLQSLGARTALGLTLEGVYSVDGDRGFQLAAGTELALGLDGGHIVLSVGGAAIDMGGGFTLKRHLDASGGAGGAYIHESERNALYRGDLSFSVRNGSLFVVAALGVEEYLYGVVPYEMKDTFPMEALKAQAVAARTYVMQRKARASNDGYDVVDTANDQVYKGYEPLYVSPIQAVDETRGIVGMYDGQYAECYYSASNGGQTALASDIWAMPGAAPYLDIRDDPYDLANPESVVRGATVPANASAMGDALYGLLAGAAGQKLLAQGDLEAGEAVGITSVEDILTMEPLYGGGSRQYGKVRFTLRLSVQRFVGDAGNPQRQLGEAVELEESVVVDLSYYDEVRQALNIGINAGTYDMVMVERTESGDFRFTARRWGHGVGLSQRGAEWMAGQHGKTYLEILSFYYPGLELVQLTWEETPLTTADALPESLGYAAPRPTPAPTPGPLPALQGNEYYAVVKVEGALSTLNVRGGPSLNDPVIGTVAGGARLIVEEETADGWAKMKTAELEGYVSMEFIEREQ